MCLYKASAPPECGNTQTGLTKRTYYGGSKWLHSILLTPPENPSPRVSSWLDSRPLAILADSPKESVNPNQTPNCSSCSKPESEHAGHGDWCPSESEDQIWSSTRKFSRSHQADTLLSLLELVERYIPTARPLMSVAELRALLRVEESL